MYRSIGSQCRNSPLNRLNSSALSEVQQQVQAQGDGMGARQSEGDTRSGGEGLVGRNEIGVQTPTNGEPGTSRRSSRRLNSLSSRTQKGGRRWWCSVGGDQVPLRSQVT